MKAILISGADMNVVEVPTVNLPMMQHAVRGDIEMLHRYEKLGMILWGHDEAALTGYPPTLMADCCGAVFFGRFILTGREDHEGNITSLTTEQLRLVKVVKHVDEPLPRLIVGDTPRHHADASLLIIVL